VTADDQPHSNPDQQEPKGQLDCSDSEAQRREKQEHEQHESCQARDEIPDTGSVCHPLRLVEARRNARTCLRVQAACRDPGVQCVTGLGG